MPEVLFTIKLPDGEIRQCYSPSSVVKKYFTTGDELPVAEFLEKSRSALAEASERVRMKFGFSCSSAASQLEEIERFTRAFLPDQKINILDV